MHILDFEKPVYELMTKIEEYEAQLREEASAWELEETEKELDSLRNRLQRLRKSIYGNMTPWQKTLIARHSERIDADFFLNRICTDFISLHGDRHFSEDKAIVGGFAKIDSVPFMVVGHCKGKGRKLEEKVERNFGMPQPEGYRKAVRLMKLAEKSGLPLLTLIDTPGAYPGVGAEKRNQSEAIAYSMQEMSDLKCPVITVVLGEGGSGGALALAVSNVVLMLEHSIYSVISPEGCASILWHDASKAQTAADALKYTAQTLKRLKVIEGVIPEPLGGAHHDLEGCGRKIASAVIERYEELKDKNSELLVEERRRKFSSVGFFKD